MLKPVLLLALLMPLAAIAREAPKEMKQFNVICPAQKLLPQLDAAYHECNKGFVNGSCEHFVEAFSKLSAEYDCQRSFDAPPDKSYVVPAVWLAGDGALEDYIGLLARMAADKDTMFNDKWFVKSSASARALFVSESFSQVLDGHMAEEYRPLVEELRKGRRK